MIRMQRILVNMFYILFVFVLSVFSGKGFNTSTQSLPIGNRPRIVHILELPLTNQLPASAVP